MAIDWVPTTPTATITLAANVATAAFNANYNPSWNDCVQPGTTQKLDGIGGVLMYRSQWKSWPGYNSLVLNWGVEISTTQRGIKWCELRQTGGVWSMYQEGIFSPGGDTRWMGSIAQNDQGAIGLCYIRSNSTSMYPSLYYTGRRSCDPLGTLPVTETLVAAGTGYQSGTNRVGDYSHMTIDPSNGTTFWATSEFMGGSSGFSAARTQIFSFDIAPCVVLNASVSISVTGGSNPTCGSQNVEFTAFPTNGGSSPSYQWQVNGVNVGVNNPVYSSATLSAGDIVTCIMTSNLPGVVGSPATSNTIVMAVNATPSLGTATISPSDICLGATATITYTPLPCETSISFQNEYAPANWVLAQTNSNGSVNTSLAPASISMVSSDGLSGSGQTNYSITIPCSGNVTFDWAYSTFDGAPYDYPTYFINGGAPILFPGYSTGGLQNQNGTASIAVNAGDVLTLQAHSVDNSFGSCTTVISNFSAPVIPNQHFDIFDQPTGGSLISWSYTSTLDVTPGVAGPVTYYAAAHSNISGCYSVNRAPVSLVVHPNPTLGTATISPSSICLGESTTIAYTPPACETILGFQNVMAPSNWTLTQVNSNGSVNTSSAPGSIAMISSNIGSPFNSGQTNFSIPITCSGNITFNWNYTTIDGSAWDYPMYFINGGAPILFPGYSTSGGSSQSGTATIAVNSGDVLTLQANSVDNGSGPCTTVISNFTAPAATSQHFDVFDAASGGNLLTWSFVGTVAMTPGNIGFTDYYVAAHSDISPNCYSSARIPLSVLVKPLPLLGTATVAPSTICLGQSTTLTYSPVTCATNIGFEGTYTPANWTLTQLNSNGTVDVAAAPSSISMTSSDGLSGSGQTNYSITVPCSGNITFDWSYSSIDGAIYDYPQYFINGASPVVFPGYDIFGSTSQSGTASIVANAGDIITLQAYSSDNFGGSCVTVISNFVAPTPTPTQFVNWYDAPTAGNYVGSGGTLVYTPSSSGNVTYYAEVVDINCTNPTRVATNMLTVNANPIVIASATSSTICAGLSTTLSATGASTYAWSPGAFTGSPIVVSPANTTVYTVVGTGSNGCTNSSFVNVFVNPLPILGTATATPASLCLGATTSLLYTAPSGTQCNGAYQSGFSGTYAPTNWTLSQINSNGTVNTGSAPGSIAMTSSNGLFGSGQTNYSITVPCTGIVSFNWSYTTPDGPSFDSPTYSINGGPFSILPGFSFTGGNNQNGTFNVLLNAGQSLTLQAYSSDNFGGACTTVFSNFNAPYSTPSTQSVTWFNAPTGGLNVGNGNPQNTTPALSGVQTFYAQATQTTTGCVATSRAATNSINVIALPNTLASATSTSICQGGSTTLTGSNATTYNWNPGGLSGTSVSVSPAATTTYTVTGTGAGGCTKTATITITVNPKPTVGTTVTLSTICAGASTAITGTGANTYTWNPGALSGTTINVTPAATTTYTVTGTNTATGCTNTSTRLITVNPLPAVGTTVTSATICAGASTAITGTGANTYTWNPGALSGTTVNVTPAATTTYTVTGTNTATGCTNTSTRLITVNAVPAVGTTVTSATICAGASTAITGTGANTYTWNPGALSGTTINVTPAATTTYTVTGTNTATGCTNTSTRLITVNALPAVGTTVTSATICAGASTAITGTGANTYTWNPGALSGTTINVTPAATTTYTVTGTSTATGCTKTAIRLITVNALPAVGTTVTSATICAGASTAITGTGANTYTWNPGALSGTTINVTPAATTTYTVTGTSTTTGCTKTATRTITVTPCGSIVNLKLFIEGYYIGAGLMTPVMSNQGIAGATASQTDTITVELRNTTSPYAVASTLKTILNTNGTAVCNFPTSGTYYIAVKHRNAVQTWSKNPVVLSAVPLTYDFSNALNKAFGDNQQPMGGGVFALFSGDLNLDENVDLLDLGILELDISTFAFGYYAADNNGDGNVDLLDSPVEEANINNFVFSNHP